MPFKVEWSLQTQSIAIADVSKVTGVDHLEVKLMYRDGKLGPAPGAVYEVNKIPLYAAAALFALVDASKKKIGSDQIRAAGAGSWLHFRSVAAE